MYSCGLNVSQWSGWALYVFRGPFTLASSPQMRHQVLLAWGADPRKLCSQASAWSAARCRGHAEVCRSLERRRLARDLEAACQGRGICSRFWCWRCKELLLCLPFWGLRGGSSRRHSLVTATNVRGRVNPRLWLPSNRWNFLSRMARPSHLLSILHIYIYVSIHRDLSSFNLTENNHYST